MTAAKITASDDGTVRDRLIRAADEEITERGIEHIQMEVVAARAGVSRATAFRQLGTVSEMLVQVALLRSRRYVAAVQTSMAAKRGVFAKLEAALLYTTRELPNDPSVSALMSQRSTSVHHPMVHQMALHAMGPVLREGQRNGEIRTDLDLGEIITFLIEQTYLSAEEIDRSDAAVRRRLRHFIMPALAATEGAAGERLSLTREAEDAVATAIDALTNLAGHLNRGTADHEPQPDDNPHVQEDGKQ
ncbi:TetR family transcriptional regulator [Mycolicibacterium flavescens]|uniref:TetR/AcrR family transcriptional regulator n=1 Tax=Mycolicibacterium flavescens TaxID=1776 RepID=UPI000B115EBB|nr:TetR/AcrR family transcriptional regulator [Mycolicibacterium flavescens]MCV7282433.1 TetR family transcriptional regulator [Mycolicibacterium flavescens]